MDDTQDRKYVSPYKDTQMYAAMLFTSFYLISGKNKKNKKILHEKQGK